MSDFRRSFGISRETGYKIYNRYREEGIEALSDRSRRPVRYANQLPAPRTAMVVTQQRLDIKEVDEGLWRVSFMSYDLGYIDLEQRTLQTIDNPFGTRLSPMS